MVSNQTKTMVFLCAEQPACTSLPEPVYPAMQKVSGVLLKSISESSKRGAKNQNANATKAKSHTVNIWSGGVPGDMHMVEQKNISQPGVKLER